MGCGVGTLTMVSLLFIGTHGVGMANVSRVVLYESTVAHKENPLLQGILISRDGTRLHSFELHREKRLFDPMGSLVINSADSTRTETPLPSEHGVFVASVPGGGRVQMSVHRECPFEKTNGYATHQSTLSPCRSRLRLQDAIILLPMSNAYSLRPIETLPEERKKPKGSPTHAKGRFGRALSRFRAAAGVAQTTEVSVHIVSQRVAMGGAIATLADTQLDLEKKEGKNPRISNASSSAPNHRRRAQLVVTGPPYSRLASCPKEGTTLTVGVGLLLDYGFVMGRGGKDAALLAAASAVSWTNTVFEGQVRMCSSLEYRR